MLKKLWPTRSKYKDVEVVADFDAMSSEPVAFKLNGKIHTIKPITNTEFFTFANAYARLTALLKDKGDSVPAEQVFDGYYEVFRSVCETISMDDIKNANSAQLGGVYQLIIDCVTGKAYVDEKKTLNRMIHTASMITQDQKLMPSV
jgi:hypothetical protein